MAKKTDNNAAFLEKFKECEQLIRQTYGDDKNFKWFEDKMKDNGEDQMSQKMYVCRVLRNYMSHNPDGGFFIDISDAMADFLDDVKTKISGDIKICRNCNKSEQSEQRIFLMIIFYQLIILLTRFFNQLVICVIEYYFDILHSKVPP